MARSFAVLLVSMLVACSDARPAPAPAPAAPTALPEESVPEASGRVAITVDGMGFHPSTIHARIGHPSSLDVFAARGGRLLPGGQVDLDHLPAPALSARPIGIDAIGAMALM